MSNVNDEAVSCESFEDVWIRRTLVAGVSTNTAAQVDGEMVTIETVLEETRKCVNVQKMSGPDKPFPKEDLCLISKYEENATILRPCLLETITVRSMFTELKFLECSSRLAAIANRNPRAAISMVINELLETGKISFWIGFCVALQNNGYGNVAKLLTGPKPADGAYQTFYIQTISPFLRMLLHPIQLLDYLSGVRILDDKVVFSIKERGQQSGRLDAADLLLEHLPKSHAYWYNHFVQALDNTGNHEEAVAMLNIPEILNDDDSKSSVKHFCARNEIKRKTIPYEQQTFQNNRNEDDIVRECSKCIREQKTEKSSLTDDDDNADDCNKNVEDNIVGRDLSDWSADDEGSNSKFSSINSLKDDTHRKEVESAGGADSGLNSTSDTYLKEWYDDLHVYFDRAPNESMNENASGRNSNQRVGSNARMSNDMLYPWVQFDDSLLVRGEDDYMLLADLRPHHFNDDCITNTAPQHTLSSEPGLSLVYNSHTHSRGYTAITSLSNHVEGRHVYNKTSHGEVVTGDRDEYTNGCERLGSVVVADTDNESRSVAAHAVDNDNIEANDDCESNRPPGCISDSNTACQSAPPVPPRLSRSSSRERNDRKKIQYTQVVFYEHKETMTEALLGSSVHASLAEDCRIIDVMKGHGTIDEYLEKIKLKNKELQIETPKRQDIVKALDEHVDLLRSKRRDIEVIRMKELEAHAHRMAMVSEESCFEEENDLTKGVYSATQLKNKCMTQHKPGSPDNLRYELVAYQTSLEKTHISDTGGPIQGNPQVDAVSKAQDDLIYKDSAIYSEYVPPSDAIEEI